ncbi:MAG TPA: trigger factor [Bacteroidia bacterium]|jgi:trigger factor
MNIIKENIDQLNAVIKVKVGPEDYQAKVDQTIKEYRKKVQMPGFRPGMVPVGMVKKMYGKSILADELNKLLNDSLYNYIRDNNIEMLGNPLPSKDDKVDFETQQEFEFSYELGLAPQFEVELSAKDKFDYETVKVDDKLIDKYVNDIAKRYGKIIHPETSAMEDLLNGDFVELDANGQILPGGVFKTVSVFTEKIKGEELQKVLTGLKAGDKVILKSSALSGDAEYITGLLQVDKAKLGSSDFQFTLKEISRLTPSEMDQEFFDKVYGEGAVKSEEEFRNKVKEELERMFVNDSEKKFKTAVVKGLMDKVKITLPDDFLKRWLLATNEKPLSKEQLEQEYPYYSDQLKWQLIENKILKDRQVKVSHEEVVEYVKELLRKQFAQYGRTDMEDKELTETANKVLAKEEEAKRIYDQMYDQRLMDIFKSTFTITKKEVNYDDFFSK